MTKRILVVGEDAVRQAFRLALADQRPELVEADKGAEGAARALAEPFDLVYLELRLPDIDGIETLRRIQAGRPDLPVCIVTAYLRECFDALVTARGQGLIFTVLRKPLYAQQIIDAVAGVSGAGQTGDVTGDG